MALLVYSATLVAITFFEMYFPLLLNMFLVVGQGHSKFPPVHFMVSGKVAFPPFVIARMTTMAVVVNTEINCLAMCIVFFTETKLKNF